MPRPTTKVQQTLGVSKYQRDGTPCIKEDCLRAPNKKRKKYIKKIRVFRHRISGNFQSESRTQSECHAPDPGPTRLADPNRSPGRDTIYTIYILCCIGTLIDLFFLRVVPVPVSIQTISVITKIIYIYQKNYHRSGVHKNLYTNTESLLLLQTLIHVHF